MKGLPIYQRVLNEEPKGVLKYKSAFQVYYARKPVSSKTDVMNDELLTNAGKGHYEADRRRRSKTICFNFFCKIMHHRIPFLLALRSSVRRFEMLLEGLSFVKTLALFGII